MKLRCGKIIDTNNSLVQLKFYTDKFANLNSAINLESYEEYLNRKAYLLNKIYLLWFKRFDEIHDSLIKKSIGKQDCFMQMINTVEKRGIFILQEIKEGNIERKTLKKNIIITLDKIENYKKLYNKDKNNLLCRLSCKIGSDLTKNINTYL